MAFFACFWRIVEMKQPPHVNASHHHIFKIYFVGCNGSSLLFSIFLQSPCMGFSLWWLHCCGAQASVTVVHGLSCSVAHGIFLNQESSAWSLHWQVNSYPLYHHGSPHHDFWNTQNWWSFIKFSHNQNQINESYIESHKCDISLWLTKAQQISKHQNS